MKVALVHDYLNEFGGAERVLRVLAEMYPEAPIYTAFAVKGSAAYEKFSDRKIVESWVAKIPGFAKKLHSPLRFMAPLIWKSFDFSGFDVVISSSSWYMTKGIQVPQKTLHVSYIHTPPRYLYGYSTSVQLQKYRLVRWYAMVVNYFLRQYDFASAQKVDVLVANSLEVQGRIKKFWRRESQVIYPPVEIVKHEARGKKREGEEYFLTGGRLVGPKHFDVAIEAANRLHVALSVFGRGPYESHLRSMAGETITFRGKVNEQELADLYAGAKGFIALATDEDFGITPVEAMMCGTPVLAYRGGGFVESVVEGETGEFVDELTPEAVMKGIKKIESSNYSKEKIKKQADKFSKERFVKEIEQLVETEWKKKHATLLR